MITAQIFDSHSREPPIPGQRMDAYLPRYNWRVEIVCDDRVLICVSREYLQTKIEIKENFSSQFFTNDYFRRNP
jgi:hypothetical protein